ncbi:MAG: hypothetical protein RL308_89 [Bacteroidota bacterium]|jgi:hypothetical protein
MKVIHLFPELKDYYMKDFTENVLTYDSEFWELDEGLKEILIKINVNENVQTLYSKRYSSGKHMNEHESYLMFTYSSNVEQKLFKELIPEITTKYSCGIGYDNTTCFYTFTYPEKESNNNASNINLACIKDGNYFNVNHIKMYLQSYSLEKHDEFWDDITRMLVSLN